MMKGFLLLPSLLIMTLSFNTIAANNFEQINRHSSAPTKAGCMMCHNNPTATEEPLELIKQSHGSKNKK